MSEADAMEGSPRLEILKALGDNTRYAIYLEVARAPQPVGTAQIAESLDLHANTVRPHLERMKDLGMLEIHVAAHGGVGRPQHLYAVAPDAPSLGLEPPVFPMVARMLLRLADAAGLEGDEAVEVGRDQGRERATRHDPALPCSRALTAELGELGFDPQAVFDELEVSIGFANCPFRELAEANPDLVCGLHQGMVEGFVAARGGGRVERFANLVDRVPCRVDLQIEPV